MQWVRIRMGGLVRWWQTAKWRVKPAERRQQHSKQQHSLSLEKQTQALLKLHDKYVQQQHSKCGYREILEFYIAKREGWLNFSNGKKYYVLAEKREKRVKEFSFWVFCFFFCKMFILCFFGWEKIYLGLMRLPKHISSLSKPDWYTSIIWLWMPQSGK